MHWSVFNIQTRWLSRLKISLLLTIMQVSLHAECWRVIQIDIWNFYVIQAPLQRFKATYRVTVSDFLNSLLWHLHKMLVPPLLALLILIVSLAYIFNTSQTAEGRRFQHLTQFSCLLVSRIIDFAQRVYRNMIFSRLFLMFALLVFGTCLWYPGSILFYIIEIQSFKAACHRQCCIAEL